MKKVFFVLLVSMFVGSVHASEVKKDDFKTEKQKLSYMMGIDIANSLKKVPEKISLDHFFSGIKDGYADKAIFTTEEVESFKKMYFLKQKDKEAKKNIKEAKKFLAENKKKKGVKTTSSGLQYKVVKKGAGIKPTAADTVNVHYKGTFIDGAEFDSSYKRGKPVSFPLGSVIKGWTEGMQLMKTGAIYEFYIPAELAYGENGAGAIGPNSTLIFEVELLEVQKNG